MTPVNVAIVGASGYMGEEIVRLLLRHPYANVTSITSRSNAGLHVREVFPRFFEADLVFTEPDIDTIAAVADIAFLALPHGVASEYAVPLLEKGVRVIDVSADFRLDSPVVYKEYYGDEHVAPELLYRGVYGLAERNRDLVKQADLVACPGCYPTSILLPTTPILAAGLAKTDGILIASMSGVTGAGRKADLSLIFAECNESARPYKVTGHRHTSEIEQELAKAAGVDALQVNFVPHLIPVNRGIHSTVFLQAANDSVTAETVHATLMEAYADEAFVRVLPLGDLADTKHVTMTNTCEIGVAFDPRTKRIIISSAIDNLCKGGSGQAVQCFNIINDFPETTGLL